MSFNDCENNVFVEVRGGRKWRGIIMSQTEECIINLEIQIDWIESIPAHQFPGWRHTVNAMKQAIALLKKNDT